MKLAKSPEVPAAISQAIREAVANHTNDEDAKRAVLSRIRDLPESQEFMTQLVDESILEAVLSEFRNRDQQAITLHEPKRGRPAKRKAKAKGKGKGKGK